MFGIVKVKTCASAGTPEAYVVAAAAAEPSSVVAVVFGFSVSVK